MITRVFLLENSIMGKSSTAFNDEIDENLQSDGEESVLFQYGKIKELEGELVEFFVKIQHEELEQSESVELNSLILTIRHAMSAAKSVKDIYHNIKDYQQSANDHLLSLVSTMKIQQHYFCLNAFQYFHTAPTKMNFENLVDLKGKSKHNYNSFLEQAYLKVREDQLSEMNISTLFNVNREFYNSNKSLIAALKEYSLESSSSNHFDLLPELN